METKIITWISLGLAGLLILAACNSAVAENGEEQIKAESQENTVAETEIESGEPNAGEKNTADGSTPEPTPTAEAAAPASPEREPAGTDEPAASPVLLGGTDISQHSVLLAEIHFDLFNGSSLPLSQISEATLLSLRDAIPPIEAPVYETVEAAGGWLTPEDIVIGYVDGNEALAYPVRILNYHEIVNETVNGVPVLISYCPLCSSGIVYDRRLNGEVLEFGNTSALYNSDMVMYDLQTLSYWFQVEGEAIVGDLTGQRLEVLPTRFMRWAEWGETYPDSRVLSRDTGFTRPYQRDPFGQLPAYLNAGRFPFPVDDTARDPALPAGEPVIGLVLEETARAYPLAALAGSVANDTVAGTPVAVVVDETETAQIFIRRAGDQTLTLAWDDDALADEETNSRWSPDGLALSGPLEGEQLEAIPARFSFWFAFIAAFPEATAFSL